MLQRILLFVLASLLATPALGNDCPTEQTAKLGFVLEGRGARAEVRPASNHFVQVVNTYSGGKRQDVIYYRGLFLVSRFDDTARTINIPVSDLRTVFPLEMKARRALTYAPAKPDRVGALVSQELTVIGQEQLRLGPCSYDVLVIRNRFFNGEGKATSGHTDFYSPELGFILAKRYERGGSQITVKYERIKPLRRNSPL